VCVCVCAHTSIYIVGAVTHTQILLFPPKLMMRVLRVLQVL
jgi:hypothetical protein